MTGIPNLSSSRSSLPVLTFVALAVVLISLGTVLLDLRIAAGLVAGICLCLLTLHRPVWGLALFCSLFTLEGISARYLEVSEIRIIGTLVFGLWLLHVVFTGKKVRVDRTFLLSLAFFFWAGLSLLWAPDPDWAGRAYGTLAQSVLLFLLVVNVIETEADFSLVLAAFLVGAVVTSPMSLNLFVSNVFERARAFEAQNANQYAALMGVAIISGIYLTGRVRGYMARTAIILPTLFLVVPLVLAQSRTAWTSVAAAVGFFIWRTGHRVRNLVITLLATSAVVGVLFATGLVNFTLVERANELISIRERGSSRFDVWRVAAEIIEEHPLWGVGFNQFPVVYNSYRSETPAIRRDQESNRDPHSVFFGVTAELGIVGLALMLAMFWNAAREERLPPGQRPWIAEVLVVFMLVFSIGGTMYYGKLFWVVLALAAKASHLAAQREEAVEGLG